MNGLSNLTEKILDEAKAWADETRKTARIKVDQILLDHKQQADALHEQLTADAETEAAMIRSRAESGARLTERNELLRAKRALIDMVFERATELVCEMPREEYVSFLARLVAKYQTGSAEIILNERDSEAIGTELLKKIVVNKIKNIDISLVKISKTPGSFKGGLILRQGDIDTNCTAEVLCGGLRHELEPKVIELLGL